MKIKLKFNNEQHHAFTKLIGAFLNRDLASPFGVVVFYTLYPLKGRLDKQQLTSRSPKKMVYLNPCEGICVMEVLNSIMTWLDSYEMAVATQVIGTIHHALTSEVIYIKKMQEKNQQKI